MSPLDRTPAHVADMLQFAGELRTAAGELDSVEAALRSWLDAKG